ncbi:hypothetical protein MLD38_012060 [Melastoma candidum]|uniref:Uncharacterized protein n=1 Tax=Melastoma candidum TaxID=119954 RepID=A0ACB9R6E4_9MYRT|nr:hypothetical protein MLD38_012060 [Melastoma candidum]
MTSPPPSSSQPLLLQYDPTAPSAVPESQPQPRLLFPFPKRPTLRVTTEFDSDSSVFFHKVSCKLLDSLAKLKLTFRNSPKGEIAEPQVSFVSKHLSIYYDVEEQNTLVKSSFDLGSGLHFSTTHDVKSNQGEASIVADLAGPRYALEVASPVPIVGLPKATLKFPYGEVSMEEKEEEEEKTKFNVTGALKAHLWDGLCTAQYSDEEVNLRYHYKDDMLSFIPRISLPSNALSVALKRRFSPSSKLSYWYNFDSNYWSAVYKQTYGKDLKFKAGYDSEVRLGWASLWVGDEDGKAKTAPMKMKVQLMLQVPQDDVNSSVLMFRVKKRWDI